MSDVLQQIKELENELSHYPSGYISRKMINGKERFYLQWLEDGKLKSKYIKADELETVRQSVEKRKELQERLKKLKATSDGMQDTNLKRKAVRNLQNITGYLMLEDRPIAQIQGGRITEADEDLLPLYL